MYVIFLKAFNGHIDDLKSFLKLEDVLISARPEGAATIILAFLKRR